MLEPYVEVPLFRDTVSALRFAFRLDYENYDTSMLADLAAGPRSGTGSGLGGLEAAGTAGLIGAQLVSLPQLWRRILIARHCHRSKCCPTCGTDDKIKTMEWLIEVSWISATVWLEIQIPRLKYMVKVRDGMVRRYFGDTILLKTLAKEAGVTENTMTQYNNQLVTELKKEEKAAHHAIDERLRNTGLVG